jgi:ABC-type oligopeptide transport system ATPase subunit
MLTLEGVSKTYRVGTFGGRELTAVRDVSLQVAPGEVIALIGESGSGKSTIGRLILRLTGVTGGRITFDGTDIAGFNGKGLRAYYAQVQGVFQDPFSSYNPIFKADRALELLRQTYFAELDARRWRDKVEASLDAVRLDPGQVLGKYPHQLSGGQLQRLLVARALLLDIRLLVADEIISMLDASTRIDVLNLLGDLKARGLGIVFITHDLSLGNYISDRAVILRQGEVVEEGPVEQVFGRPQHPYTRSLLASVPQLHRRWEPGDGLAGEPAGGDGG